MRHVTEKIFGIAKIIETFQDYKIVKEFLMFETIKYNDLV
jgi:hypothetical protein